MNRSLSSVVLAVLAVATSGCLIPRSAGFMQTAAPVGKGGADVGVALGASLQSTNSPPTNAGSSVTRSNTFGVSFPAVEANAQVGVTDMLGVNLHLSSAGIQPGLKLTLLSDAIDLAVLPEGGFGCLTSTTRSSTTNGTTTTDGTPSTQTRCAFLVGFKAIVSHRSGVYGGLGYDFQTMNVSGLSVTSGGSTSDSTLNLQSHNITMGVGIDLGIAQFRIRPELSLLIAPALSSTQSNGATSITQAGGTEFYFFPNITFAVHKAG